MLIVVTSDCHGRNEILKKLVSKYPDAAMYLDAGDSGRSEAQMLPFLSVKGNRDYLIKNIYRIEKIGDYRIFVFHGDRQSLSKENLFQIAKNNKCNIIIHGHTHVPYHTEKEGIHILCPGSVVYPRSRHGATYALIRIDENIEVEIKKVKDEK